MKKETWKPIPGCPGYTVSAGGKVKSYRRFSSGKLLKQTITNKGYRTVVVGKKYGVHRLVMLTFVGPVPCGKQVAHLNGKPSDNRLENLAYVTPAENQAHRKIHGTELIGTKHPYAKLTAAQVRSIRKRYKSINRTTSNSEKLAEIFGVCRATIMNVIRGNTYSEVLK